MRTRLQSGGRSRSDYVGTGGLPLTKCCKVGAISSHVTANVQAGWDGLIRIYTLDLAELLPLAQSRVTRSLTEAECRQYLHLDACPERP